VHVLGREEEARLAFDGAVSRAGVPAETIGVCDVGGGSTQLAIGTPERGPAWLRSFDVGSLRLASRAFTFDPPGKKGIALARRIVRAQLDGLAVPLPMSVLAVGGSARGLRKLVGRTLGEDELREAVRVLRKTPADEVAQAYGLDPERARSLPAGAVILAEIQRRLGLSFEVARGGLREGVALSLLAEAAAA
jgi:exopolyphosphatase/guanosine-5'-triphosphate,3'-diphosphate pyrophosphatase